MGGVGGGGVGGGGGGDGYREGHNRRQTLSASPACLPPPARAPAFSYIMPWPGLAHKLPTDRTAEHWEQRRDMFQQFDPTSDGSYTHTCVFVCVCVCVCVCVNHLPYRRCTDAGY